MKRVFAKPKLSQQEMVGFVIIVVLVLVGGIIFFLISAKKDVNENGTKDDLTLEEGKSYYQKLINR